LRIQAKVQAILRRWLPVPILIAALAAAASGSPIRPDLQKLLSKPHAGQERFTPARAGWEGPETGWSAAAGTANPSLERFGMAATAREVRAGLIAAALPDPRLWAFLAVIILLLRTWLPKIPQGRPTSTGDPESNQLVGRAA
jgi:hypothetical protein